RRSSDLQGGEALERGVRARVLVALDELLGAARLYAHRHDLLGEGLVLLSGDRAPMGAQAELVLFGARDAVLLSQVLGGLDHAPGDRMVDASGGHAPPG